jgi:cytochrome c peroxidase
MLLAPVACTAPQPAMQGAKTEAARVALGRRLFYDADLSIDGTMSCATCHEQHRAFTEGNRTHPGVNGRPGRRNVMALANVFSFSSLTWGDPTQRRLEDQALVPIHGDDPVEMGMKGHEGEIATRLERDACYRRMFAEAFPGESADMALPHITLALAAFERTLTSRDAPYDRYRLGDKTALSDSAQRGVALFAGRLGCASCHAGPLFTDAAVAGVSPVDAFHNIGAPADGGPSHDFGLSEITGEAKDAGRFRTPSLRNIALTAPYLHDGSAAKLPDAIRAHHVSKDGAQPAPISEAEMTDLVAFLNALTDMTFVKNPNLSLPKTHCGKRG